VRDAGGKGGALGVAGGGGWCHCVRACWGSRQRSSACSQPVLSGSSPGGRWVWTLAPGDRRTGQPHRPGSLELLTVQTGTVALDVRGHHAEIPAGDSAWFDATRPHAYANPAATSATFTLVVLEPA
jgi:Cupin domain